MHPIEHSTSEVHGFSVIDVTHRDPKYRTGDLIWVGCHGEGQWLTPAEALELATAITHAANAAAARQATGSAA